MVHFINKGLLEPRKYNSKCKEDYLVQWSPILFPHLPLCYLGMSTLKSKLKCKVRVLLSWDHESALNCTAKYMFYICQYFIISN